MFGLPVSQHFLYYFEGRLPRIVMRDYFRTTVKNCLDIQIVGC